MDKNRINLWFAVAMFVVFIVLVFSGFLLHLHPFGNGGGGGSVLNLTGQEWKRLHMLSAMIFLAFVIVHLVLHCSWGGAYGKKYTGIGPWVLGTITGLLLLGAVLVPFFLVGDATGGAGEYRGGRGKGYGIESNVSGGPRGGRSGVLLGDKTVTGDYISPETARSEGGGGHRWGRNR